MTVMTSHPAHCTMLALLVVTSPCVTFTFLCIIYMCIFVLNFIISVIMKVVPLKRWIHYIPSYYV